MRNEMSKKTVEPDGLKEYEKLLKNRKSSDSIKNYIVCMKCMDEKVEYLLQGMFRRVGTTDVGLDVYCELHGLTLLSIDFEDGETNLKILEEGKHAPCSSNEHQRKKLKLLKVSMGKSEPTEFFMSIDDSISDTDLKTKEFRSFVKKRLVDEWYHWDIPKGVLRTVKIKEVSEDEVDYLWIGAYKKPDGNFNSCVAFNDANIESSICYSVVGKTDSSPNKQVYLSCSLEKTKELWNNGEIEELKSYFIPDSRYWRTDCPDVEDINKMYDSRNGNVVISVRNKENLQKKYKQGEVMENLVDNLVDNK
jgi:hypothetical protein